MWYELFINNSDTAAAVVNRQNEATLEDFTSEEPDLEVDPAVDVYEIREWVSGRVVKAHFPDDS